MSYYLDYYSTYGSSGKIYVRCLGGDKKCKVRYYLYDSNGYVKSKTAYDDELVMFYYPCLSVYKIYADVYPESGGKIKISTGNIKVYSDKCIPPKFVDIKPIKTPLSLVSGQDNYLIVKFVKGGLKKLRNESSAVVPVYYQIRHAIKFVPCFERDVMDKIKKYSPELESLKYEYIVHPKIKQQLLLDLGNELQRLDYVELCDLHGVLGDPAPEGEPTVIAPMSPAPADPTTPDFISRQGYLFAGLGMSVQSVWDRGISGQNITVRLRDTGIFPEHEDLVGITERSSTAFNNDHGTAAAGVIYGRNNGFGVKGIAHSSDVITYNNEEASWQQVIEDSVAGDVVSIPLGAVQDRISLPLVHHSSYWDRIRAMSDAGVIVVIAAGNSGRNLMQPPFVNHGNSGAIIAAACVPSTGQRLSNSNFNIENMVNSWGMSVTTCGYGDLFNPGTVNRRYTAQQYFGTSPATSLVAGVVALIQSYARTTYHITFDSQQMFFILDSTGKWNGNGGLDMIGRMPLASEAIALVDSLLGPLSASR